VVLDGRKSYDPNPGGGIVAYQWMQLPIGVHVVLSGTNSPTPTFKAPLVPSDKVLGFSL